MFNKRFAYWEILYVFFCHLQIFFKINFLENFQEIRILSGLIWVQTVCKGYQQTTLVGKELGPLGYAVTLSFHLNYGTVMH